MARILGSLLSHAYGALGGNDHSAAAARKLIRKLEESPKADFRELSGGRSRRKLMDNRIALWILSLGVACIGGWVFHVTDASMPIGQQRLPYGLWAVAGVFLFGSLFAKRLVITPQSVRLESILGTSRVMSFNRIEGCRVEVSKVTKDGRDIIDASIQIAGGREPGAGARGARQWSSEQVAAARIRKSADSNKPHATTCPFRLCSA